MLGAALVTGSLMLGVYTIVEAGGNGWGSAQTLGQGAVALALMAFFLARQAIAAEPLLPLRLFRSRNVSGANVILMLLVAGLFGMFFLGSLYLERVLGYEAIEIGLAFLPVSVGIGVLSLFVSPRLGLRFGPRAVLLGGLTLITLSLLWMARLPVEGEFVVDLLPAMLLLGAGAGISFPQIMSLAMSAATPQDSGLLSGLINTTQQVGAAVGLAVLATLATERSEELLRDGASGASALTSGYTLAFAIGAGFVIAAIAVAVVVLRSPAPPAEDVASRSGSGRSSPPTRRGRVGVGSVARRAALAPLRPVGVVEQRVEVGGELRRPHPEQVPGAGVVEHDLHVEVRHVDRAVLVDRRAARGARLHVGRALAAEVGAGERGELVDARGVLARHEVERARWRRCRSARRCRRRRSRRGRRRRGRRAGPGSRSKSPRANARSGQ